MLALTGKAAVGTNRVALGYHNPKVFQSSRRDAGAVQLVDINARARGKKTIRGSYRMGGVEHSYKAQVHDLWSASTTNDSLGQKFNDRSLRAVNEGKAKLFRRIPVLYYNSAERDTGFRILLPPGGKVYTTVRRFFKMLGFEGEREISEGRWGFEHDASIPGFRVIEGKYVWPMLAVARNDPMDDFHDVRAVAAKGVVHIQLVMAREEQAGWVTMEIDRPLGLADSRQTLKSMCAKIESRLGLSENTFVLDQVEDAIEMYVRPSDLGGSPLRLSIVFDSVATKYLNLQRPKFEANLTEIPNDDEDVKLGLLLARRPPSGANNAMLDYLPYVVMTDSPPYDSWVAGRGNTSVLAYADLGGTLTAYVRKLSPDFNCFTLLFYNPDLTEMIFEDELELNVFFTLT